MAPIVALAIPQDYGYVMLAAVASTFVGLWQGTQVTSARKAAKVPYPNCYATAVEASTSPEKYKFNCAQRAHANYLENLPMFLVTLLVGGVVHPKASATLGAVWVAGRITYALGYVHSKKERGAGRYYGSFWYLGMIGLWITSGLTIYKSLL